MISDTQTTLLPPGKQPVKMLRFASWSLMNGSQFQYCEYELKFWCFGLGRLWKTVTDTYKTEKRQWPCITNWSVSRIYITVQWTNLLYLTPSVRLSKTDLDSGIQIIDYGFLISGTWIQNPDHQAESYILRAEFRILQAQDSGFSKQNFSDIPLLHGT